MVLRTTSLGGLRVLRDFDFRQITKWRSKELRKEFSRLMHLKWQTITRYRSGIEIEEAKQKIVGLQGL